MLRPTGRSMVPATMIMYTPKIVPPLVPTLTPLGQGTGHPCNNANNRQYKEVLRGPLT